MKFLLLTPLALSMSFGYQVGDPASTPPFVTTWLEGNCLDCKVADSLGTIQFVTDKEVWGVGDRGPQPGAEGTGDHIVLHSQDGGLTWREIAYTYMHAVPPAVSFLDSAHGWIGWREVLGDFRLQSTSDGGKSWQDLRANIHQFPYPVDITHWYGAIEGKFLSTEDGGRTWGETKIPHLGFVYNFFFYSRDVGWIAGIDGKDLLIFRTVDGGRTWKESRTAAAQAFTGVDDLFFVNAKHGWLITSHGNDHGSDLFSTVDGGQTWKQESNSVFRGEQKSDRVVRFLSAKLGFVFGSEQPLSSQRSGGAALRVRYTLAYTSDGGSHWRQQTLPYYVTDCHAFAGGLRCSATDDHSGFRVLTLQPK